MKDIFRIWEPGQEIIKNKYLEGLYNDHEGLKILLREMGENKKVLQVTFKTHFAYRSVNESYRLKSLGEDEFENGINYSNDSKFLRWLKEETHNIYDDLDLTHYLICTNDDITDIISAEEPILAWL
jgi:hypothetical protein